MCITLQCNQEIFIHATEGPNKQDKATWLRLIVKMFWKLLYPAFAISLEIKKVPQTDVPPPPTQYTTLFYDEVGNDLYAFGGNNQQKGNLDDLWKFSLEIMSWDKVESSSVD